MKNFLVFFNLIMGTFLIGISGCSNNSNNPYNSGSNPGSGGGPPANTVFMQNVAFVPPSLTISKGTTLTWVNKDGFTHTSTSDTPGLWDTGDITAGASKTVTFSTAGTFHYHCKYHSSMGMVGTIIVQ